MRKKFAISKKIWWLTGTVLIVYLVACYSLYPFLPINQLTLKILKGEKVTLTAMDNHQYVSSAQNLLLYTQTKEAKYLLEAIRLYPNYLYYFYQEEVVDPMSIFPFLPRNINTSLMLANVGSKLLNNQDKNLSRKGLVFLYLARKISDEPRISNTLISALTNVFKDYPKSQYLLASTYQKNGKNLVILQNLARLNRRMKNYVRSASYFEICRRIDPYNESYLYEIASDLDQLGKYEEAITYLEPIKIMNPKSLAVYFRIADICRKMQKFGLAESELNDAIRLDTTYLSRYQYGLFLFQIGEYQRAIVQFTLSSTMKPDNVKTFYYRCICYLNMEKYALALKDCEQGFLLEPANQGFLNLKLQIEAKQETNRD